MPHSYKPIPVRFMSYNIEMNQIVSVRFRVLENDKLYMEIGLTYHHFR